jgi:hypothetical protein
MFEYLDSFDRPVGIVETGCVRQPGNWAGDGGSTILFDRYAQAHPGSTVHTVDIDPKATGLCRSCVSACVRIHTGDSVAFLRSLADGALDGPLDTPLRNLDLLYLDSFDWNPNDSFPSAFHHLKELVAVAPLIRAETLVVVDDSPSSMVGFFDSKGAFNLVAQPRVDGKGKLIAEYAAQVGAQPHFSGYQCGWTRMRAAPAERTAVAGAT